MPSMTRGPNAALCRVGKEYLVIGGTQFMGRHVRCFCACVCALERLRLDFVRSRSPVCLSCN